MTSTAPARAHADELARRRTFAIISHPDAGKTTLTEKFLLYSGAVQEAGAVKSRKTQRTTTSDWMKLEQQRGISISSTVLGFVYDGWTFNLLDTPGHADFSEDTYRTLWAADAAVMVLDAAKGLEPQTLKLFQVCRERGIPVVTFVNKCDRATLPPLQLLDEVSEKIGLHPVPVTWPVGDGPDFAGVIDRRSHEFVRFERTAHGATIAAEHRLPVGTVDPQELGIAAERWQQAVDEVELLDAGVEALDIEAVLAGIQTPVFFGSALTNFGVSQLLEGFAAFSPTPRPQPTVDGGHHPVDAPFAAQVFKVQANMNPRHRDRVAFLRVNSGRFRRGMTATVARTGRPFQLKYAHHAFGDDRETVDEALPGDIVGVVNATDLQVGDTLYEPDGAPVAFAAIPSFAPERFACVRNADSSRYKQFRKGLRQLDEEGVVHVFRRPELGDQDPIFAGVGQLQFDVAAWRLEHEFGAAAKIEPAPWRLAREVDDEDADRLRNQRGVTVAARGEQTIALFTDKHALQWTQQDHPDIELRALGLTPES